MRKIIIIGFIVLVSSSNCRTSPRNDHSLDSVVDAIARQDFLAAQREASAVIRRVPGGEQRREALFYRALAAQSLAETSTEEARRGLYLAAAADYEKALTFDSHAGGVLNNLARVYAALGDPRARSIYGRAIALADNPNRALYLKNFAAYELAHGRVEEARRLERAAADLAGDNREAQQQLIQLHLSTDHESFVPYVQQLIDSGATTAAEDAIIGAFHQQNLTVDQEIEFAILLSRALVRDRYDPTKWADLRIAKQIERLAKSGANVAPAMAEITLLHTRPLAATTRFEWWRNGVPSGRQRDAFARLAHRLGAWYAQTLDFATAGQYIQVAVDVGRDQQSRIEYLSDLAEVMYAEGDIHGVRRLARDYDRVMPHVTVATPREEAASLYGYHRTIGLILDEFQVGGSAVAPDAAPYHLASMIAAAQRYGRDGDQILPIDPQVVHALTSYLAQSDPSGVLRARTQVAQTYLVQGETMLAMGVLRATDMMTMTAADQNALSDFTRVAQDLGVVPQLPSPSETRIAQVVDDRRYSKE